MLVNDLDLRLTYSASTFYPWKLDGANPTNPATNNSENNVDNVEMVYIATPAAGTYTITVDHDGTITDGSQAFSIIISGATVTSSNPPSCTNPVSPVAGATNVPINSSLSWEVATGATGYILYFGTDNPPTNLVNGTDLGNVTAYSPSPALNYSQTYYWKVLPYNADGQATGCSTWSFTTLAPSPPSCTNPVSPAAGATNVPVNSSLSWEAASGATGYILYFGTNNPPSNIVNGTDLGNVTAYTPSPALNYSQTYYWKVVPYNAGGQATGCSTWSFTTENNPYIVLPYTENFETGFGQWQQATDDNFNWARIIGDTPTAKTSPKKAYNGSYYIYTEASSPQAPGNEASLEATFTFAGISHPEISLYYHMYGSQMGTLHVDVYNGSWTYNVWSLSGQQQTADRDAYRNTIINLSSFANQTGVKIRIRGTIGSGEKSDLSIDLVKVRQQGSYTPIDPVPLTRQENEQTEMGQPLIENATDMIEIYSYNHLVYIRKNSGENINGQVAIFNTMGQIMKVIDIDGANAYELNTALRPGIYIIRLTTGNNVMSRKIPIY
jgi:hypothetical protein